MPQSHYADGAWQASESEPYYTTAAQDVADFIHSLGKGPAHIVGSSMGGQIAHMTALQHPDVTRSAYLFEGIMPQFDTGSQEKVGPILQDMWGFAKKEDATGVARVLLEKLAANWNYDKLPENIREAVKPKANSYIKVLNTEPNALIACEESKSARSPILLVVGSETTDAIMQLVNPDKWSDCVDVQVVNGVDHTWPGKAVEDFVKDVTAFADKHQ